MPGKQARAVFFAVLAAALYALSAPAGKLLLSAVPSTLMAAFLYLGAGLGMFLLGAARKIRGSAGREQPLTKRELPYTIAMVALDIAAPVFLMMGLERTTAANASLLNNFEIVATSLIALCIFKERISPRLWAAIALVATASMLLSFEDMSSLDFSFGSVYVLLACVCWGFENNCTRMLSSKDPLEVVVIKGLGSGLGALALGLSLGERLPAFGAAAMSLLLGFVAYGLSIYFYIYAQRDLGAARTSAYYAISPFIGAGLSLALFRQWPTYLFWAALGVMAAGTYLASAPERKDDK